MNKQVILTTFNTYTNQFDSNELKVQNKKKHTIHVAENCEWIARELGLSDDQIDLAWLIGILHDIGRFEQIRCTKGYDDEKLDHAEIGVRVLFEDGLISGFTEDERYYDLIKSAVRYHNKLSLPSDLSEAELLFCNIIRDADKIDGFRGFHESDFESFHECTRAEVQNSEITDGVMKCFREHTTIPFSVIETKADFFFLQYAMIFGIAYPCSFKLIEEQGNYSRMLDFQFEGCENQRKFEVIKREIAGFLEGRMR